MVLKPRAPIFACTGAHVARRSAQEILMSTLHTTRFVATVVAAAASAFLLVAPAQAQETLTRAEVQQQTLAAMQAGELMPAGEGLPQGPEGAAASSKTREQRKAETMEARRKGEFHPGGLGNYKSNMSQQTATSKSTKTRGERKSETMQAIKEHKMTPAGEAA
jgi:Domain of unknown function (DUF4148)